MVDASDAASSDHFGAAVVPWREEPVPTLGFGIWDFLVPVRGYEKWCSAENVEFVGIAA
jgi:hypothetical protein